VSRGEWKRAEGKFAEARLTQQNGELLLEGMPPAADTADFAAYVRLRYRRDDGMREAWRRHGGVLLAQWVAQHPGTRPWAWWMFEAPDDAVGRPDERLEDYVARLDERDRETEAAFLRRHGLLQPSEA
jgi:hypothetical protein